MPTGVAGGPAAGRSGPGSVLRSSLPDLLLAAGVMAWIGCVLLVDAIRLPGAGVPAGAGGPVPPGLGAPPGAAEPVRQVLLGLATWAVLAGLLRRESALVRTQTLVVVALATGVEYTFSPLLQAYVYRIGTVPLFVPPGHGLVYLAALALGRSAVVRSARRPLVTATVVLGGAWGSWGVLGAGRPDHLGAFWFCCLFGFLAWGPSRTVYVGAFVVVSYLELTGTALGTWAWATRDPVLHVVGQGNPPSGAAGGYGWFDLYALLLAPRLLTGVRWVRAAVRPRLRPPAAIGPVPDADPQPCLAEETG
ncbi:MAG TPA: hypothetical protein VFP72_06195 [Kineosporiaceae bacterium]|nr:hypothetical protein [Kineosporiaceae bacterium]